MAVSQTFQSNLALKILVGADEKGQDIFKNQTFAKIQPDAELEKVAEVGMNAAKLFNDAKVIRVDKSIITKN